jgi:hypothetical protein
MGDSGYSSYTLGVSVNNLALKVVAYTIESLAGVYDLSNRGVLYQDLMIRFDERRRARVLRPSSQAGNSSLRKYLQQYHSTME